MKTIEVLEKPPGFNKCQNSGFNFWQYGTTFTGVGGSEFVADRWLNQDNLTTGVFDVSRQADTPTNATNYSLRYDVTTAETITNSGYLILNQKIEGYVVKSLYGKSIAVSFWVKSNKVGTYCVNLKNDASNRSYISEYIINVADTWEQKIVVIPHELVGTWETTTNAGVHLNFILDSGSDYYAAADTWHSSNVIATSNQTHFADSTANYIQIAEIMVYEGRGLADGFVLHAGTINSEELSCYRYYVKETSDHNIAHPISANQIHCQVDYKVPMRVTPTIILFYASTTGIVRSLMNGSTPAASVAALSARTGFGRIDSAGLFNTTHLYHFGYIANAEF